ncbi:hypothetical protein EON65_05020, partial [archaeon]
PPTILDVDPATTHLTVPESGRNFLISPPGSPPEGWQPILEDAPNAQTLADDLHRALQGLMLNGLRRDKGKEVILDGGEGGVRRDRGISMRDIKRYQNHSIISSPIALVFAPAGLL